MTRSAWKVVELLITLLLCVMLAVACSGPTKSIAKEIGIDFLSRHDRQASINMVGGVW